jgi:hypothetical protein
MQWAKAPQALLVVMLAQSQSRDSERDISHPRIAVAYRDIRIFSNVFITTF